MKLRIICIAVTALVLTSACVNRPDSGAESTAGAKPDVPYLEDGVKHVSEQLTIGGQFDAADIDALSDAGVTRVVNFRTPSEIEKLDFDEENLLNEAGIAYSALPLGGDDFAYNPSYVSRLDEIIANNPNDKILLHCGSGYRASVVTVAWLVQNQGMPLADALQYAVGWWPLKLEEVMDTRFELEPVLP